MYLFVILSYLHKGHQGLLLPQFQMTHPFFVVEHHLDLPQVDLNII